MLFALFAHFQSTLQAKHIRALKSSAFAFAIVLATVCFGRVCARDTYSNYVCTRERMLHAVRIRGAMETFLFMCVRQNASTCENTFAPKETRTNSLALAFNFVYTTDHEQQQRRRTATLLPAARLFDCIQWCWRCTASACNGSTHEWRLVFSEYNAKHSTRHAPHADATEPNRHHCQHSVRPKPSAPNINFQHTQRASPMRAYLRSDFCACVLASHRIAIESTG